MKKVERLVLMVVVLGLVVVGGYEFYQKKINLGMGIAEQWRSNQFSIVSEIPGLKAKVGNRRELERYLRILGVWDGIRVDGGEGEERVKPKRVVIHLTYNEYEETWYVGENGEHLVSGKVELDPDGETGRIYLGFDEGTFQGEPDLLSRAADNILFEVVYARTRPAGYEKWATEIRDAKRESEPFFKLTTEGGGE